MKKSFIRFWLRFFRPSAQKILNSLRVRTGSLGIKFHHYRFGWEGLVRRHAEISEASVVTLRDSIQHDWSQTHYFHPRHMWSIKEALFDSSSGVVYLKGIAISESIGGSVTKKQRRVTPLIFPWTTRISKRVMVTGQKPKNYYHWLLEDLPGIVRTSSVFPESPLLLGNSQPSYVYESLDFYRVTWRTIRSRKSLPKEIIISGKGLDDSGWPHPSDIDILRSGLNSKQPPEGPAQDLFISRSLARRTYGNNEAVEAFFRELGVQVVYPERLSFEDQVKLFSNARTIIGPHGAGLANIVFSRPGALLIELAPVFQAIQCFELVARELDIRYCRILVDHKNDSPRNILGPDVLAEVQFELEQHRLQSAQ